MKELPRIAVLDTKVLLLWLVGNTDANLLKTFKRVSSFDPNDLSLLWRILRQFHESITTPHVLAEVSNFVDQAPLYRREALVLTLQRFAERISERYEKASALVGRREFRHLALADTGLTSLSSDVVVITTDYKLANQIDSQGGHVINFNHLRTDRLLPR
jgi:hypothetical protein